MRFADLTEITANGADFFAADLLLATMSFAVVERADLSFANLEGADFFAGSLLGSDLRSAILSGADLRFVTLHQSILDSRTLLDSRWKRVWELVNGQTKSLVFTNQNLGFADLREADLRLMNFAGSDFSSSISGRRGFARGQLHQRQHALRLIPRHPAGSDNGPRYEIASRAGHRHGWSRGAQPQWDKPLQHVSRLRRTFKTRNLTNANLSLAILFQADLRNSNLRNANLGSADLRQANLLGAITNGASFFGVTFGQTIMPDGSIR